MKIKKVIIILLIILTIVLVILGIISNHEPFHFTHNIFFGKQSNKKLYAEEFSDIDTIYIDVDNAIIKFINHDSDKIRVEIYSNRKNISLKSYNKKLSIMTENKNKCFMCTMNVINVYAPSSFKEYINVNNDYGHVSLENFDDASISITNKFGDIDLGKVNMLKIVAGRGNITAKSVNEASIKNNWGNVEIGDVNVINLQGNISSVKINSINKNAIMEIDFGNITIDQANINKDSAIINNCGDITIHKLNEDGGILNTTTKIGKSIINN